MAADPPATRVDARGMRCPWPALRLARAMAAGAASVDLLADDPMAAGEIAALARERGWTVMPLPGGERGFRVAAPA